MSMKNDQDVVGNKIIIKPLVLRMVKIFVMSDMSIIKIGKRRKSIYFCS